MLHILQQDHSHKQDLILKGSVKMYTNGRIELLAARNVTG